MINRRKSSRNGKQKRLERKPTKFKHSFSKQVFFSFSLWKLLTGFNALFRLRDQRLNQMFDPRETKTKSLRVSIGTQNLKKNLGYWFKFVFASLAMHKPAF